ncbi:RNA guanylyltransferase, putative [Plasmodium berghei]|uniref:mRNA guanylyltransferase n=3 Tax=Plasmodium berghei TaxID=5821 RepID=A0A509ALH4_PLABA|nr:mRNA-capping enzyme subunit alpha, putative [Plasmodium berghei ANKA]CXI54688.1 RNA guanylyltransferase, putative [Plasmodium berghei]SCL95017.1 RNA guanylyltransferase, putative [Plasmodium berghei]SCM17952.1 RNA guanylyltransferase, putative [Plasmodium berghei]VUC56278.1 mRNA-capping enzyme subunit alpha, putative [Plasmodium berghei ANKA]|eukprot:XP_034422080.1 mRNA-capping enzyme subunit alpha, putative [Plasmodium berghei ANKA]
MVTDIYNPGDKIENEFLKEKIRGKINEMLKWKRKGFPGSNPVSLTKHNIKNLFNKDYLICEKTDGVRYFLFIVSNTTFLIDRNYDIFKNDMHIPTIDDLEIKQQLTLLDGELVEDIIYNDKKGIEEKKIVYLIYDGLFIQRKDITNLSYLERLTNVYNYVITPLKMYKNKKRGKKNGQLYNINNKKNIKEAENDNLRKRKYTTEDIQTNKNTFDNNLKNFSSEDNEKNKHENQKELAITDENKICDEKGEHTELTNDEDSDVENENTENEPFNIYLKDFYSISQISELLKIMKKLPHTTDGIIFTPLNYPYVTGNFYQLLKWKPLNLNTVDFGIETIYNNENIPIKFELFIAINGIRASYKCYLAEYGDVYKQLLQMAINNKISHYIVECYYVSKNIYSICKNDDLTEKKIEGGWIAQKIRYDKNIPNDIMTLNKVMHSILDNITIDTLIKEVATNSRGSA